MKYFKEVLYLIGEEKKKLPFIFLLFLFLAILDLASIGLIAPYVELILKSDNLDGSYFNFFYSKINIFFEINNLILFLSLLLIFIFLIKTILSIFINKIILKFCFSKGVDLRSSLMQSYQNLDYEEFINRNSSEYIHNISLADRFANTTLFSLLRITSDLLVALSILFLLAYTDIYALILLSSILGILIFSYDRLLRPKVNVYGKLSNEYSKQILKGVNEGIEGLKELRILGRNDHFHLKMKNAAEGFANVNVNSTIISTAPRFLLELLMIAFIVLLVLSTFYSNQELDKLLPTISMFGMASIRLAPAANQLLGGITRLRFGRHGVGLLYEDVIKLKNINDSIYKNRNSNNLIKFSSLELKDISFKYPNMNSTALEKINWTINEGEVIGLMGPSGSGKTTLMDIILGLLKPQFGSLYFNKKPLNDMNIKLWQSNIAYLPQEIFLIDNSIKRNIALGLNDDEIDEEKIKYVVNAARLSDLVKSLPNGLDTIIGERGIRISGGQKQRIALARAFYHNRNILVMDESTSSLDNETEEEVIEQIKLLKGNKTLIIVAHRLTTLKYCDKIYILRGGKIQKCTSYDDLITINNHS